jgi:5-formyltetrahydrofolate cyclo-ligase
MNKSEWRKKMKQLLLSIGASDRRRMSESVSSYLYQMREWKDSQTIGITISRKFELDTTYIIKKAWEEGKKVGVPKCYSHDKKMEFREILSFHELENVYMDLYEPRVEETPFIFPDQIDLLVVPGLVFDKEGFRIGYGGGYYDRYLQNYKGAKISLAYTGQTTVALPHEEYDIPVDQIITENGRFK